MTALQKKQIKYPLVFFTIIALLVGSLGLWYLFQPKSASAAWFDDTWSYRATLTIGNTGSADSNKKVKFDIDTATLTTDKLQADCGDSRFTDVAGNLLDYYIDSAGGACDGVSTDYYVLVPTIPAGNSAVYHYYGNPSASNGTVSAQFSQATFSPTSGPTAGTEEKAPSPAAYWKFDDGTGTTAQDSSQNNNDGTLTNGPTWQTEDQCISGKCLYFDGSNDYVDTGNGSSVNITGDITLAAWVKPSVLGVTNDTFSKVNTGGYGYEIYIGEDNKAGFVVSADGTTWGTQIINSGPAFDINSWHYIVGTNSASGANLYVDGVLVGTDAAPATSVVSIPKNLEIGRYSRTLDDRYFKGFIDDVRIYPYARTAQQILSDYNSGQSALSLSKGASARLGGPSTGSGQLSNGLVGYWKMDESSGNAADSSGNSLTLTNNAVTTYVSGKFGNGSEHVPASSQYLSTATTISGVKTVSFWVNPDSTTNYYTSLTSSVYITSSSGTISATGFTSPTVYVNGVVSSTLVADTWQLVTVTTDTAINADTFYVGRQGSNYFDGTMDEVRIYNRALTSAEVTQLYNFAPGPVGYWNFENGSGTSVSDRSGQGNTGTASGATWATGKYGKALDYDGTDDVTTVTNATAIDLNTVSAHTYEAWVYADSDGEGDTGQIYQKGTTTYLRVDTQSGSNLDVQTSLDLATTDATLNISTVITTGTWNHIVVTYEDDSDDEITIYVNGVNKGSSTDGSGGPAADTNDLLIGGTTTANFDGKIDEFRFYNYARTPAQIIEDMNAGHPAPGSPIGSAIGYWKFDEGYGTTAYNSGNQAGTATSLNGTLTNMASPATASSGWTNSGKFGKALVFDGSNDYVEITDNSAFDLGSYTLSAWIKNSSGGTYQRIVSQQSSGSAYWNMSLESGTVRLCDAYLGANCQTTTQTVNNGTWRHVLITREAETSQFKFYIDGQLVKTSTGIASTAHSISSTIDIGYYKLVSSEFFSGSIDDVKIYNFALTSEQVKTEYNQGAALVLGNAGNNSSYQIQAANQEYCVPGDTTSCAAPVGEWKFEAGSGTSAVDTSGNANTGTLTNGPTWVKGKVGKGLSFDGSDDYVSVGDLRVQQHTISAWVKLTDYGGGSSHQSIVCKGYSSGGDDSYCPFIHGNNTIHAYISTTAGSGDLAGSSLTFGQWTYITQTWDGSTLRLYVNGMSDGTPVSIGGTINYDTKNAYIGADNDNGINNFFTNGSIDDVRIYNYARTAAQIAWEYNKGAPVGWWKFDECQGTVANDSSGNGNTGTITIGASGTQTTAGTCTGSANQAWKDGATGKINSSLDFDGTDDYISVSDTANLRFDASTADFSLFAWVKRTTTGTEYIISKEDADNDGYRLQFNSSNQVLCSEDATDVTSSLTITDTNWHLVGCTIDRDGNGQIYIDGKADGSTVSMGTDAMATTVAITLGTRAYTATSYMNGQIDDVRIYNYALTASQVKDLYNGGAVRFGPATGAP